MNILYITHCDPRATDSGSAQRSRYLWEALKEIGTVYTVFNVGAKARATCDEDNKICSATLAPDGYFRLHLFARFNSMFSPFVWPFRNRRILRHKMPWKDVVFDLVVVRYLGHVALANAWMFGDVYVDIDDLPSESFNTIRRGRMFPPFGWLGSLLVSWWQRYILSKCKAAWIANSEQVPIVAPICQCEALQNIPMPLATGYRVNDRQRCQLMTVGLMGYEPNYEGVEWFLDKVWPSVHYLFPGITYKICGRDAPGRLRKKWSLLPGVEVMGFVADIDKVYEESLAVVAPISAGAGTCIKVPEATLRGRKVFATPFAVRGLAKEKILSLGIEVASTADEMIAQLASWLGDEHVDRNTAQNKIAFESRQMFSEEAFAAAVKGLLAVNA